MESERANERRKIFHELSQAEETKFKVMQSKIFSLAREGKEKKVQKSIESQRAWEGNICRQKHERSSLNYEQ